MSEENVELVRTFLVMFEPTEAGARAATLTVGMGGWPEPTSRAVALTGTATPEPVAEPITPPASTPTTPAKKKCKEKKGEKAGAAKQCGKK